VTASTRSTAEIFETIFDIRHPFNV